MTPSEAHESAWKREPGHDEMVVECREMLLSPRRISKHKGDTAEYCPVIWTECEAYLKYKDRNHGFFADIMMIWEAPSKKFRAVELFEVKPKIHSCGALVRQLKAQDSCLEMAYGHEIVRLLTLPIVREDDPLFPLLRRMIGRTRPIISWDGSSKLKWWTLGGLSETRADADGAISGRDAIPRADRVGYIQ